MGSEIQCQESILGGLINDGLQVRFDYICIMIYGSVFSTLFYICRALYMIPRMIQSQENFAYKPGILLITVSCALAPC